MTMTWRRVAMAVAMTAALGAAGCGNSDEPAPPAQAASSCDGASLAANKDLALRVSLKVFLANEPADGVLSKDFVAHFPSGQPDQKLESFLGFGTQFRAALPDAAFAFTHVIASGDLVALRYIGTGTHKGELFGIPATNQPLRWEGMVVRRIAGGLVVEEWNEPDNAGLVGQLSGRTPALSPEAADHRGTGDCSAPVIEANLGVALGVSRDVVLGGKAPDSWVSAGFTMHNPNGLPDQNLQGFLGFNAGFRAAFPDAAFTFTHQFAEGGLVFLRYTATGTHKAEFFGVPATDRSIAWEGAVVRRIDSGKAAEEWNAPDIAGILGQLTAK
jgi:predicted ester cyclase